MKSRENYSKFAADDGRELHDDRGYEVPDPTPMAPPVGYKAGPTLIETIRAMVKSERLAQEVAAAGAETFEEADDFDVGDDYDPTSPYETDFEPSVAELRRRQKEEEEAALAQEQKDKLPPDQGGSGTEAAKPPKSGRAKPATPPAED